MIESNKEQVGKLLMGRRVTISVGEPWDFESPDGPNTLCGRLVGVGNEQQNPNEQTLHIEVTPFNSPDEHTIDHLLATKRHTMAGTVVEQVARGEKVVVNFDYSAQIPPEEQDPGKGYLLIGSFWLEDDHR